MKKLLSILLALLMLSFMLFACNEKGFENKEISSDNEESSTETENPYQELIKKESEYYEYVQYEAPCHSKITLTLNDLSIDESRHELGVLANYKIIENIDEARKIEMQDTAISLNISEINFEESYLLVIYRQYGVDEQELGIGYRNLTIVNNMPCVVLDQYYHEIQGAAESKILDVILISKNNMPTIQSEGTILVIHNETDIER